MWILYHFPNNKQHNSASKMTEDEDAWNHFCTTLNLPATAISALKEMGLNTPSLWYQHGQLKMLQGKVDEVFQYFEKGQIKPVVQNRLIDAWLWLESHKNAQEGEDFCRAFCRDALSTNEIHERKLYLMGVERVKSDADHSRKRVLTVSLKVADINRGRGGMFWKEVEVGSDFFSEAKDFIIEEFALPCERRDLHLGCYLEEASVPNRVEFQNSNGYWSMIPSSRMIYFWIGKQQDSPLTRIANLEQTQRAVTNRLKRLEASSRTAADQAKRWDEKTELEIEAVEDRFPRIALSVTSQNQVAKAKKLVDRGPVKRKEVGVQEMWNKVFPDLVSSPWKDCRNPNGIQFDGRRHDIDLVLLHRDIVSILYLDTSIELKDTIASDGKRREVVLQLLDRFAATFDGQPERKECWGLGMDDEQVLFVKCLNDANMTYQVSANCLLSGSGWELLLRFLRADPSRRGYTPFQLPRFWGQTPVSKLGNCVYLLPDNIGVCKVGDQNIEHEIQIRKLIENQAPFVAPRLLPQTTKTGNTALPFGFLMLKCDVTSLNDEEQLLATASETFWRLGVLHELGIVHKDVKPSNILLNLQNGQHVLSDYGAAVQWQKGDEMTNAATDSFGSINGCFKGTEFDMCLRDLESLFWTIFLMWLQIIKGRETSNAFRASRRSDLCVLQMLGGAFIGENEDDAQLRKPSGDLLTCFLVGQARKKELLQPLILARSLIRDGCNTCESFNKRLRVDNLLPCPPDIFEWFSKRWGSVRS